MNFSVEHVVGEEGRVAARHGARRSRRWASTPSSCATRSAGCAVAGGRLGRRVGDQRRRRLARAPHPGPARLLHDPPATSAALDGMRIAIVGDIKHSPGGPLATCSPSPPSAPRSRWWRRRRCCRRASTAGRSSVSHDLDARAAQASTSCYLLRMQRERMTEALLPSLREYTAGYGLTAARADLLDRARPGDAPGPDEPGRRDRRRGRRPAHGRSSSTRCATAWPCAWRCCSCCSAAARTCDERSAVDRSTLVHRRAAA